MSLITEKIASKAEVQAAHRAGIPLQWSLDTDDLGGGRLQVLFKRDNEVFVFSGRLFRASSYEAAVKRAEHQFKRMLGRSSRITEKLSDEFLAAREVLRRKAEAILVSGGPDQENLLIPHSIKVDWNKRRTMMRIRRQASWDLFRQKYDPEYSRFCEITEKEFRSANLMK